MLEHPQEQQGTVVSPLNQSQLPPDALSRRAVTAQPQESFVLRRARLKHHTEAGGLGLGPGPAPAQAPSQGSRDHGQPKLVFASL